MLSRLSEAAECQRPYLSKVLQPESGVHLTPDHMHGISRYLNLDEKQTRFLALLLEKDRASSPKYREHIKERLAELKTEYLELKNQVGKKDELSSHEDNQSAALYYSNWLYSALHIAVSIPELQTLSALSKRFSLPAAHIQIHLFRLEKMGLIKRQRDRWHWLSGDLHLSSQSQWIGLHHGNWRGQAALDATMPRPESLHYSVVQSISKEDVEKLKLKIMQWVKEFSKIASPSAPEELVCLNLDFFKPGSSGD